MKSVSHAIDGQRAFAGVYTKFDSVFLYEDL